MSMKYEFNQLADRANTGSVKWDVKDGELPMWVADMDFLSFPEVGKAIRKRAAKGCFGYTELGDRYYSSIISWWKKYHGVTYRKEWILFATGVIASLSSIIRRITHPGEKILLHIPAYNTFFSSISNNGRVPLLSKLIYENGQYSIDWEDLERKLSDPLCSLFIICNPHNPTGRIWTREELDRMGHLAQKHGVTVVSDEIHCDLANPGVSYVPYLSVSKDFGKGTIVLNAPTKIFNLPGLMLSSIVVPDEKLRFQVFRGINNDEVAEPNAFVEDVTAAVFSKKGHEYVTEINSYIYENKKYFVRFVSEHIPELKVTLSDATYLLWVDVSYFTDDSVKFCEELRKRTGLYVCDGLRYRDNSFFRINLATSLNNVKDACNRLLSYVEGLRK